MCLSSHLRPIVAFAIVMTVTACDGAATSPEPDLAPQLARTGGGSGPVSPFANLIAFVDDFNATMAQSGQTLRLDYPWLYRVGWGTDPFQTLRTGVRWTTLELTYLLDASDYTTDLASGVVESALVSAFDTWNDVPESRLTAMRIADPGHNMDVLDGTYDGDGNCVDPLDVASPNLDLAAGVIEPEADIVVGGWAPATYFSQCLGSELIIGITWSFYDVDANGDQYKDLLYVEQFYNPYFWWVDSGALYLDPVFERVDLETIAVHENGHALGLGHFGGPLERQPFKLKPNGRVFNPEAVMNPFYLGGEDHALYPTDEAGLLTLYAGDR